MGTKVRKVVKGIVAVGTANGGGRRPTGRPEGCGGRVHDLEVAGVRRVSKEVLGHGPLPVLEPLPRRIS